MNPHQAHRTMINILDCSLEELRSLLTQLGQPGFRADQIWQWVWQKGSHDFQEMTNLSRGLRASLAHRFCIEWPHMHTLLESRDGTLKLLLELSDGALVETVLIPERDHFTQCLSSQVGCPLACTFCSTGDLGFSRNLTSGEILGQVLVARDLLHKRGSALAFRNLVFMGMGEPLLNWEQVVRSLVVLGHDQAFGFSRRRITVSTVGIRGMLAELGNSGLASLAVSLHAPTQELRARLMPRASRFPLDELLKEMEGYPLAPRQRITVEYILIGGVNDSLGHARELTRALSRIKCKVNLITFNPGPGIPYAAPGQEQVLAFEQLLRDKGLTATLRKSKGQDIAAACGQLRAQCESSDRTDAFSGPSSGTT